MSRIPAAWVVCALLAGPVAAHEGHDHDAEAARAAPAPSATEAARFAVGGDVFELVGALEGRRLVLWLDRIADTSPVTGATIELDFGGRAMTARATGDTYLVELDAVPAAGRIPIAVTVLVGGDSDLLAAELSVPGPAGAPAAPQPARAASEAAGGSATGARSVTAASHALVDAFGEGPRTAIVAGIAAVLAAGIGWALGRRRRANDFGSRS
ncbi:MAG: hypothetical protein EHM87_01525 [Burkholderiales bacterium]|nr:MAG: hypothetical protein EHM87_01525 [Burkholderiales bacterium]